jgi:transcription elongation factor GreA
MPKIAEAIAEARAEGDLSENAEYHGQREAQGMLQAKINSKKGKLAGCYIVDQADNTARRSSQPCTSRAPCESPS